MKIKGKFLSQPLFWPEGKKDSDAMDIGDFFDRASNLKGVTCNGKLTGLKTSGVTGDMYMELQTIAEVKYIVIYKCDGTEWARFVEQV